MTIWIGLAAFSLSGLAGGAEPSVQRVAPPESPIRIESDGLVSDCIAPRDRSRPLTSFSAAQRRTLMTCLQAAAARQANSQLPAQIDEVTRLERVTTSGPLLLYHYSVAMRRAELPAGAVAQMAAGTHAHVCGQEAMRRTMALGGAYGYRWVDSTGALINQIRIDRC